MRKAAGISEWVPIHMCWAGDGNADRHQSEETTPISRVGEANRRKNTSQAPPRHAAPEAAEEPHVTAVTGGPTTAAEAVTAFFSRRSLQTALLQEAQ